MFRIYYGDGTTFEGEPEDAPRENVQCIAIPPRSLRAHETKDTIIRWTLVREADVYIYTDPIGNWIPCTHEDAEMHERLHGLGLGGVRAKLWGLWLKRDLFDEIILRAERDFGMTRR